MKKIIISCLSTLSILSLSCKKVDVGAGGAFTLSGNLNPNTVIVHLYQTALDYIQLPVNRYFIYKDSATGVIDSVKVTKSLIETNFQAATSGYPGQPAIYSDVYKLTLTKFAPPSTNQLWFEGTARGAGFLGLSSTTIIDSSINFSNDQNSLSVFWHPLTLSGFYQFTRYTYLPTLSIEGITYATVHFFSSSNGLPTTDINYQASVFYWVKGIGIIKKEIRTFNSVKTSLLVRYG